MQRPDWVVKIPNPDCAPEMEHYLRQKIDLIHNISEYNRFFAELYFVEHGLVRKYERNRFRFRSFTGPYVGWFILQKRVVPLQKYPDISRFDWNESFTAVHHHFWRSGIGLSSHNELLGFFNKGRDRTGRVLSFDIGSLTNDKRVLELRLGTEFQAKMTKIKKGLKANNTEDTIARYEKYIASELNLQKLDELWPIN